MSDLEFELELKKGFLEEASQLLTDTEQCFLDIESRSDDPAILDKIFRLAHNLKGSARGVGFNQMGEFTHVLESLLLKLKKGELTIQSSTVTLLLKCNDHLKGWVDTLKADFNAHYESSDLLSDMNALLSGVATPPVDTPVASIPVLPAQPAVEAPAVAESVHPNPVVTTTATTESPASMDSAPASAPPPSTTGKTPPAAQTPPQEENIRVSLKRLEKLLNNVGELVIMQTVLNQQRLQIQSPLVQKTIAQLAKITKDIQDISMSLRMVPLKQTFQKMQRIVRDTSKTLSKDVHLELHGEETELDKTVVENLGDPLVHLIRNAVDHGIESSEDRVNAGKPAAGTISLMAYHQGSQIVIEIRDDGKGLNPQKLIAKALEKGLIRPEQKLSDEEAYNLIFAPGFSTHNVVTEISGRGVGMDVVKTNVEKLLQGEVLLSTQLGKGTTFKIILPLTLAIIDGMVVKVGDEKYIIPITQVHESIQPTQSDVHYVSGLGEVLGLRGESLPLYRLCNLLGLKTKSTRSASESIAIVVRDAEKPFAILVDDIIGQQQVVIKQLGAEIRSLKGITGGAILGDGRAALIIDATELVTRAQAKDRATQSLRGTA